VKKIMNMAFIAIASIAMISTMQARFVTYPTPTTKQQITSNTKNFESTIRDVKKAQTPEEKQQAKENAIEAAQELLKDLEERSVVGDVITGYSEKQRDNAKAKLKLLEPLQIRLNKNIELLEKRLATVTDKGWIWNAPLSGKDKEYNIITARLNKLKESLKKVDRAIRNQSVIAGKEWSNAFRALVTGAVALGIDKIVFGGAGVTAAGSYAGQAAGMLKTAGTGALSTAGTWLKEKGTTGWEYTKIVAKHGMRAASILLTLYTKYSDANAIYTTALSAYKRITDDPSTTPENRELAKNDMIQKQRERDKSKIAYDKFQENLNTMSPQELQALMAELKK